MATLAMCTCPGAFMPEPDRGGSLAARTGGAILDIVVSFVTHLAYGSRPTRSVTAMVRVVLPSEQRLCPSLRMGLLTYGRPSAPMSPA